MELPVGTALQPLMDFGRLVRGDVVEDDMDRGSGIDPLGDAVEEGEELLGAVPPDRLADDLAGGDVERDQKAGGAVPPVMPISALF